MPCDLTSHREQNGLVEYFTCMCFKTSRANESRTGDSEGSIYIPDGFPSLTDPASDEIYFKAESRVRTAKKKGDNVIEAFA